MISFAPLAGIRVVDVTSSLVGYQLAAILRSGDVPGRVDGERFEHRLPPPLLGEHSVQVLRELGYSDDHITALIRAGTVGSPA